MEYRRLNVLLISAEGIKDVNLLAKMDVYAIASIAGVPASQKRTPVHKDSGVNPKWNHRMEFVVDETDLHNSGHSLLFQIMAESLIRADKEIGSVTVPFHELFKANSSSEEKLVEYQVRTLSGKAKGKLKFSYCFGDKFTQEAKMKTKGQSQAEGHAIKQADHEPVTAYPAGYPPPQYGPPPPPHMAQMGGPPPHHMTYMGGPPPPPNGYGYPQHGGYGYHGPPPPQYGYPPAGYAAGQKKKNKMGMGLGLGLGAGLLGGLLVGEVASDIGDAMAYEDGFDF